MKNKEEQEQEITTSSTKKPSQSNSIQKRNKKETSNSQDQSINTTPQIPPQTPPTNPPPPLNPLPQKSNFCAKCCKNLCIGFFLLSTILYGIAAISFKYTHIQTCNGEWGSRNPPLEEKNGFGICSLDFELRFIGKLDPLIKWKSWYEGNWLNGKKHGKGKYVSFASNSYEGSWKEDSRVGNGVYTFADGTKFIGSWEEDKFTGKKNILYLSLVRLDKYSDSECIQHLNGSIYIGDTVNGLPNGNGKILFPQSSSNSNLLSLSHLIDSNPSVSVPSSSVFSTVTGRFRFGLFIGGTDSKFYLQDGSVYVAEEYEDFWDVLDYTYESKSVLESLTTKEKYIWNGDKLIPTTPNASNTSFHDLSKTVHCLKWFELHFLEMKKWVESDIYTFEEVDKDKKDLKKDFL